MTNRLRSITLSVDAIVCNNLMCSDVNHTAALDAYANAITDAFTSAATVTIPHTRSRQHGRRTLG